MSDTKPDLDAIDRLRGAIREAANYAEADEVAQTEAGAAILHTLSEALRTDLDDATDRDDLLALLPTVDWEIVARSMMAKVREIESWQDSVNRERRADRARAEASEAERDQLAHRLDQLRTAIEQSQMFPSHRDDLLRVLDGDQRTEQP